MTASSMKAVSASMDLLKAQNDHLRSRLEALEKQALAFRIPFAALTIDHTGCEHMSRDIAGIEKIAAEGSEGPTPVTYLYAGDGPTPTHRHKKRGTEYVLIGYGRMQASGWHRDAPTAPGHSILEPIDMREVAVYRSVDDGSLWVRPREEFDDGRFADVRHD